MFRARLKRALRGNCGVDAAMLSSLVHAVGDADGEAMSSILCSTAHTGLLLQSCKSGGSVLHLAVATRHHAILASLLAEEGSPAGLCSGRACAAGVEASLFKEAHKAVNKRRGSDLCTPLMLACDLGDMQSVRLLLAAGADPWRRDRLRRTALHYAAARGHAAVMRPVVEASLRRPQANSQQGGRSFLGQFLRQAAGSYAVNEGRELVDVATHAGFTPLMYAAWNDHAEAAAALLELGAKLGRNNWETEDPVVSVVRTGFTALHIGAANNSSHAIRAILTHYAQSRGLRPLSSNGNGSTAAAPPPPQPASASAPGAGVGAPGGGSGLNVTAHVPPGAGARPSLRPSGGSSSASSDPRLLQPPMTPGMGARPVPGPGSGAGAGDPRLLVDGSGRLPFNVARTLRNYYAALLLNPLSPLEAVLGGDAVEGGDEEGVAAAVPFDVPRLAHLAAEAAHKVLLAQVQELGQSIAARRRERALAAQQQQQQQQQEPCHDSASSSHSVASGSGMDAAPRCGALVTAGQPQPQEGTDGGRCASAPREAAPGGSSSSAGQSADAAGCSAHVSSPRSSEDADPNDREDDQEALCGICLDVGDFIETRPCGHKMCVACATELLHVHSHQAVLCPFCRCMVRGFGGH